MFARLKSVCSLVMLGLLVSVFGGCKPKVGDACSTALECSVANADRICLTAADEGFPGGYCTSFNCGPSTCSEEALCVGYRADLGDSKECSSGQSTRLRRSYCMLRCNHDSDCRSGYVCVSVMEGENPWGAAVLNPDPGSGKVCAIAYTDPGKGADRLSEVCRSEVAEPASSAALSASSEASAAASVSASASWASADAGALDAGGVLPANSAP